MHVMKDYEKKSNNDNLKCQYQKFNTNNLMYETFFIIVHKQNVYSSTAVHSILSVLHIRLNLPCRCKIDWKGQRQVSDTFPCLVAPICIFALCLYITQKDKSNFHENLCAEWLMGPCLISVLNDCLTMSRLNGLIHMCNVKSRISICVLVFREKFNVEMLSQ